MAFTETDVRNLILEAKSQTLITDSFSFSMLTILILSEVMNSFNWIGVRLSNNNKYKEMPKRKALWSIPKYYFIAQI